MSTTRPRVCLLLRSFSMRSLFVLGIFGFLAGTLSSCQTTKVRSNFPPLESSDEKVVVMTFNVENLFDTEHDLGKDDYTFLPLERKSAPDVQTSCAKIQVRKWRNECLYKDWSESLLKIKLERIAKTILQVSGGRGPDILFLQEVENLKILERLRTEYLSAAEYQPAILLEGPDSRGIDVAILTRFPLITPPKLHTVNFKDNQAKETRGILQAQVSLPAQTRVTLLSVHLPSPGNPVSDRDQVFMELEKIRSSMPPGELIIVGGDFNTTKEEDTAIGRWKSLEKLWLVSHVVGCEGCLGTHYFHPKREWSFLDVLLFSKSFEVARWRLDANAIQVVQGFPLQLGEYGGPASLEDVSDTTGVSDHLPVAALLRLRE